MAEAPGHLVLVAGPSGAGKDTLIEGARRRLEGDACFVFPRREITRPADAGGEDHVGVSRDEFAQRRSAGGYALSWEAHGLGYGVPASILSELAEGRTVIVNVSRTVIEEARARFPHMLVVSVTAPEDMLFRRLAERGRESGEEATERLRRASAIGIAGPDVVTLCNDGSPEEGIAAFLALIGR
jgi:ribose 1,5-bisphosphokinase